MTYIEHELCCSAIVVDMDTTAFWITRNDYILDRKEVSKMAPMIDPKNIAIRDE